MRSWLCGRSPCCINPIFSISDENQRAFSHFLDQCATRSTTAGNEAIIVKSGAPRTVQPRISGQNLLAARVSRDFWKQSYVGGIFTRGNPTGLGNNTLIGATPALPPRVSGEIRTSASVFSLSARTTSSATPPIMREDFPSITPMTAGLPISPGNRLAIISIRLWDLSPEPAYAKRMRCSCSGRDRKKRVSAKSRFMLSRN